jgi:hypothetical protein
MCETATEAPVEAPRLYQAHELVPALAGLRAEIGAAQGAFDREWTLLDAGLAACRKAREQHACGDACPLPITDIITEQVRQEAELAALIAGNQELQAAQKAQEAALLRLIRFLEAGLDVVRLQVAEPLLAITNHLPASRQHARQQPVEEFVRWVAAGCPQGPNATTYQDGWPRFQEKDTYGGGSISYEIALTAAAKQQVKDGGLTPEQQDALVYYCAQLTLGTLELALAEKADGWEDSQP